MEAIGTGSGPNGRIIASDVTNFDKSKLNTQAQTKQPSTEAKSDKPKAASAPAWTDQGVNPFYDTPNSKVRKVIGKRLLESKTQIPHFYVSVDCNVDTLLQTRKAINETLGLKVSVNDIVIKACAKALVDVPQVNSQWSEEKIRTFKNADISVAVATDGGLITPIVFQANNKSLSQISTDVKNLAAKAKSGTL